MPWLSLLEIDPFRHNCRNGRIGLLVRIILALTPFSLGRFLNIQGKVLENNSRFLGLGQFDPTLKIFFLDSVIL